MAAACVTTMRGGGLLLNHEQEIWQDCPGRPGREAELPTIVRHASPPQADQLFPTAPAQSQFTPIWVRKTECPTKQSNFSTLPLRR